MWDISFVHAALGNEDDQDLLYAALKRYHDSMCVEWLVDDLKHIIQHPKALQLFDDVRPLIPLKHQLAYDRLAPTVNNKMRAVKLYRKGNEGLGFNIRGGLEHGTGIYISEVVPFSQAWQQGLKVGDQIIRVNGFTIDQATHEEVINLIKAKNTIAFKVKSIGMIPDKEKPIAPVTWKYIEKDIYAELRKESKKTKTKEPEDIIESRLFINIIGNSGLGCSICKGPEYKSGIFVESIKLGGLAAEAGLTVGDEIISVNGQILKNLDFSEVVCMMKASKQLDLVIKKGTGLELFPSIMETKQQQELEKMEEEKILQLKLLAMEQKERERAKEEDERRRVEEKEERIKLEKLKKYMEEEEKKKKEMEERLRQEEEKRKEEERLWREVEEKRRAEEKKMIEEELERQRKKEEKRRKLEEEEKARLLQIKLMEEAKLLQEEMKRKKEREWIEELRRKEEVKELMRLKRVQKEKLLLENIKKHQMEDQEKEIQLKVERINQETQETKREIQRAHDQGEPPITFVFTRSLSLPAIQPLIEKHNPARRTSQQLYQPVPPSEKIRPNINSNESKCMKRFSLSNPVIVPENSDYIITSPPPPPPSIPKISPVSVDPRREPLKSMLKPPNIKEMKKKSSSRPCFGDIPVIIEEIKTTDEEIKPEDFDPFKIFTARQIDGREVQLLIIEKGYPLEMSIEGGSDSPLTGRIIVSEVWEGGTAEKHGITRGDQLMMVDGRSLIDITLNQAQNILKEAMKTPGETLTLIVAKALPNVFQNDVTLF